MALSDHLRAHQDVRLVLAHGLDDSLVVLPGAGRVAVPALDARLRQHRLDFVRDPLGAEAEVADAHRGALRAALRRPGGAAAVVAHQPVAHDVIGERQQAVLALQHVTAFAAHHEGVRPAPVEEQNGLLLAQQRGAQLLLQLAREDRAVARLQLLPHVHDPHRGHPGVLPPFLAFPSDPLWQCQQGEQALLCPVVRTCIRRRAAQNDFGAYE